MVLCLSCLLDMFAMHVYVLTELVCVSKHYYPKARVTPTP